MTETAIQQVVDTDDVLLRRFTYEYPKVFAKFTAEDCAICTALAPCFAHLVAEPANAGILFVRLSVKENPVAQQLMLEKGAPFFVSYCQGRLLECDALTTEIEVVDQLARLRASVLEPR
ncbi:MAG: hypothetical protein EOO63_06715 [Hymenobacter sp.]|nr:MAG: hypothetical protein EOO63_06715 [Hymenobacter sp.]